MHAFLERGKKDSRAPTDLLHEIDGALRFGKGFLLGEGLFSMLPFFWFSNCTK